MSFGHRCPTPVTANELSCITPPPHGPVHARTSPTMFQVFRLSDGETSSYRFKFTLRVTQCLCASHVVNSSPPTQTALRSSPSDRRHRRRHACGGSVQRALQCGQFIETKTVDNGSLLSVGHVHCQNERCPVSGIACLDCSSLASIGCATPEPRCDSRKSWWGGEGMTV